MFANHLNFNDKSIRSKIPFTKGVYIISIKLHQQIAPIPVYIGSTNNLRIRINRHIKNSIDKSDNSKAICRLLSNVRSNIFTVTFHETENYLELEKELAYKNSKYCIPNLLNAKGAGRSYLISHKIAMKSVNTINTLLNIINIALN